MRIKKTKRILNSALENINNFEKRYVLVRTIFLQKIHLEI